VRRPSVIPDSRARGLVVVQIAISVLLIWLAINVAFVVLRLRAVRPRAGRPASCKPISSYQPHAVLLHHRIHW
jgi:hypothetical protein